MNKLILAVATAGLLASSTLAVASTAPMERVGAAVSEAEELNADGDLSLAAIILLFGGAAAAIIFAIESGDGDDGPFTPISP